MINWHRLFGLALIDYFTGTDYDVEVEVDVAHARVVSISVGNESPTTAVGSVNRAHLLICDRSELKTHTAGSRRDPRFGPLQPAMQVHDLFTIARRQIHLARGMLACASNTTEYIDENRFGSITGRFGYGPVAGACSNNLG